MTGIQRRSLPSDSESGWPFLEIVHDSRMDTLQTGGGADRAVAFEGMFEDYYADLAGYGVRLTGQWDIGEDLANEAMLRVWRNPGSYKPELQPFCAWLLRITKNVALDHKRKITDIPVAEIFDARIHARSLDPLAQVIAMETIYEVGRLGCVQPGPSSLNRGQLLLGRAMGRTIGEEMSAHGKSRLAVNGQLNRAQQQARTEIAANYYEAT